MGRFRLKLCVDKLHVTAELRHRGLGSGHFPSSLSLLLPRWAALPERNNEGDTAVDKRVRFPWRPHPQACALDRQSLEVQVPARPLRVGCGQWRGHTWFGCPLSSSVRSRGSELRLGFSHTAQRGPFTDAATPSEAGTSASLLF